MTGITKPDNLNEVIFSPDEVDHILHLNDLANSSDPVTSGTARILKDITPAIERHMKRLMQEDPIVGIEIFVQVFQNILMNSVILRMGPAKSLPLVLKSVQSMMHHSIDMHIENLPYFIEKCTEMAEEYEKE